MTRPSDFILNSDYLSIAQTGRSEHTATFAGGTLQPGGSAGDYVVQTTDFTIPSEPGSIDRIMISTNGGDFYIGSQTSFEAAPLAYGSLDVCRITKNTMRATMVVANSSDYVNTFPSMSFRIKITSFRPPNIF